MNSDQIVLLQRLVNVMNIDPLDLSNRQALMKQRKVTGQSWSDDHIKVRFSTESKCLHTCDKGITVFILGI